jgi:hypothetical protein
LNKTAALLLLVSVGPFVTAVLADAPSLESLRQGCEAARESRLAPLRAQSVEECVSRPRTTRTRADCERIYRDLGQGGGIQDGGARPPMFMDLPECRDYVAEQNRQRGAGQGRSGR